MLSRYQPMEEEEEVGVGLEEGKTSDSDSFSSDPRLCRQSPPTQVFHHTFLPDKILIFFKLILLLSSQVQSLSEESSGCSTRRRPTALSPSSPR